MWKKDENGNLVVDSKGNPIWVNGDKEDSVDYGEMINRLNSVTSESIGRKEQIRDLTAKLEEAEKLKGSDSEVEGKYKGLLEAKDKELAELKAQNENALLSGAFNSSKFIQDNIAVPAEMIRSQFGKHFSVENGKVVAKDAEGRVILSTSDYGNPASFEEAITALINQYPHKDSLLKSSGNQGSSTHNGGGGSSKRWDDYSEAERVQLNKSNPQLFNELLKTRDEKEK